MSYLHRALTNSEWTDCCLLHKQQEQSESYCFARQFTHQPVSIHVISVLHYHSKSGCEHVWLCEHLSATTGPCVHSNWVDPTLQSNHLRHLQDFVVVVVHFLFTFITSLCFGQSWVFLARQLVIIESTFSAVVTTEAKLISLFTMNVPAYCTSVSSVKTRFLEVCYSCSFLLLLWILSDTVMFFVVDNLRQDDFALCLYLLKISIFFNNFNSQTVV